MNVPGHSTGVSFDDEYELFRDEAIDLKYANVSKQDTPMQLEIWRAELVDWLNELNVKSTTI